MLKKVFLLLAVGIFFVSCATVPTTSSPAKTPQEIVVKVQAADPTKVTVADGQGPFIPAFVHFKRQGLCQNLLRVVGGGCDPVVERSCGPGK